MTQIETQPFHVHRLNLFNPRPLKITGIAWSLNSELLAITKKHAFNEVPHQAFCIIEIYKIYTDKCPKVIQTIIEYEQITGIVWASAKHILTTSKEQSINIYNASSGCKAAHLITDYGPISCLKFIHAGQLLLTGTEYGYVAAYKIDTKNELIKPLCKMVKINSKIRSLDTFMTPRVSAVKSSPKKLRVKTGKRKRSDSSDESETDEDELGADDYLSSFDLTIYGASEGEVVAWDYHKKTIVETIHVGDSSIKVNSILTLKNGDIVTGDSSGKISIFDNNSFTCRQSLTVLQSEVLCLAKNSSGSILLVSGRDPTVIVLKEDKMKCDEYMLFEKIEVHTHDVNSIIFTGRKQFFSGGVDGLLVRYKLGGRHKKGTLDKKVIVPNYSGCIHFHKGELMIQYDKSLVIWKLPDSSALSGDDLTQMIANPNPVKLLLIKTRLFIHASTFNDKWIAYSTKKDIHFFNREEGKLTSHHPDKKLPYCNLLRICHNSRYLVATSYDNLYLINLGQEDNDTDAPSFKIVGERRIKSKIDQMIHFEPENFLVVAGGPPNNVISVLDLKIKSKNLLQNARLYPMQQHDISFITRNGAIIEDPNIYVYTHRDQIVKLDISQKLAPSDFVAFFERQPRISGLPEDVNILGMVIVSQEHCILYDDNQLYRIDMMANQVVNQESRFKFIVKMDNFVFSKPDHLVIVELRPEDYLQALPQARPRKKFGMHLIKSFSSNG